MPSTKNICANSKHARAICSSHRSRPLFNNRRPHFQGDMQSSFAGRARLQRYSKMRGCGARRQDDMGADEPNVMSATLVEPPPQRGGLALMFRSLRTRDFALFWTGNFLSNIGTWMQNIALGWQILVMTNSPFLLGLNGFLGTVPSLVFSLPGGAIADRLNRRKPLLVTQTSMALLA